MVDVFLKKDILYIESQDPQFIALKNLYKKLRNKTLFYKLSITNALLSYQLNITGEKYWENFSIYFSKNKSINNFEEFLYLYNKRFINNRIKRLNKIKTFINSLNIKDFNFYKNNLLQLNKDLAKHLNQHIDSKTIVFAIKIFIYCIRITDNIEIFAPSEIFIPLDSRIKKINPSKNFWKSFSKQTHIPLLHIDSILWLSINNNSFINKLKPSIRKKIIELHKNLHII